MVSMLYHGILPWFTCFKTPWCTMAFTMVYFHKGYYGFHGISWYFTMVYNGLPVSKHHGIYNGIRWYIFIRVLTRQKLKTTSPRFRWEDNIIEDRCEKGEGEWKVEGKRLSIGNLLTRVTDRG